MTSCTATHTLDYDALSCHLKAGHAGPHQDKHVDGAVWWQKQDLRKHHG